MDKLFFGAMVVLIVGAIVMAVSVQPYNEARTFNKFSEKKATTWDALWAELRVEACRNS